MLQLTAEMRMIFFISSKCRSPPFLLSVIQTQKKKKTNRPMNFKKDWNIAIINSLRKFDLEFYKAEHIRLSFGHHLKQRTWNKYRN